MLTIERWMIMCFRSEMVELACLGEPLELVMRTATKLTLFCLIKILVVSYF